MGVNPKFKNELLNKVKGYGVVIIVTAAIAGVEFVMPGTLEKVFSALGF